MALLNFKNKRNKQFIMFGKLRRLEWLQNAQCGVVARTRERMLAMDSVPNEPDSRALLCLRKRLGGCLRLGIIAHNVLV